LGAPVSQTVKVVVAVESHILVQIIL